MIDKEINKRIKKVLEYSKLNKRQFAIKIGMEPQTIGSIVNYVTNAGKIVVNQILATFPEISSTWLREGKGEMIKEEAIILNDPKLIYNEQCKNCKILTIKYEHLHSEYQILKEENKKLNEEIGVLKYLIQSLQKDTG